MSGGISGPSNPNSAVNREIPSSSVNPSAPSQSAAVESPAQGALNVNSDPSSESVFGTSNSYQAYMDLPPAELPDHFDAAIALTQMQQQMIEDQTKSAEEMIKGMGDLSKEMAKKRMDEMRASIENLQEQRAKQKKMKIFGWVAKAAALVAGAALIATGAGAALGGMMIAMVAIGSIGNTSAVQNNKALNNIFKVANICAQTACVAMTGGAYAGILAAGMAVSATMTSYSAEIAKACGDPEKAQKWIAGTGMVLGLVCGIGAAKSANLQGGSSAANAATKAADTATKQSVMMMKVGTSTLYASGIATGIAQVVQGSYSIELGVLKKQYADQQAAMMMLDKLSREMFDGCQQSLAEVTEELTEYNKQTVEFITETTDARFQGSRKIKV